MGKSIVPHRAAPRRRPRRIPALLSALLLLLCASPVRAAEAGDILAKGTQGESVVLYIKDPGEADVSVQIGNTECSDVTVADISGETAETLMLVDNSMSINQRYRPMVNELLTNIAANRAVSESFTVATFTDQIHYITQNSSDYAEVKRAIDSIRYDSHDSYLLPALYELFAGWEKADEPVYRKLIVVSDGASEEDLGYSLNEMNALMRRCPYPIYTFGAVYQDNSNKEQLENLFSLSRATRGESWRIGDITDSLGVSSVIAAGSQVRKVTVRPPAALCDGTEKGILLTAGGHTDQTTMVMPFVKVEALEPKPEAPAKTPEPPRPAEQPKEPEPPAPPEEPEKGGAPILWIALGAAAVVAAGAAAAVVLLRKKKDEPPAQEPEPPSGADLDKTISAFRPKTPDAGAGAFRGGTAMVFNTKPPMLVLSNADDPNESYKAPLTGQVLVGRRSDMGCAIVIPDQSISKKHCVFRYENRTLFVSDAGSKNGTVLNGRAITQETRIDNGSVVKLGNVELKVEIRNAGVPSY